MSKMTEKKLNNLTLQDFLSQLEPPINTEIGYEVVDPPRDCRLDIENEKQ